MTKKEFRDQSAHAAAAVLALAPVAFAPSPLSFAWAGFCIGMVREITEEGAPVTLAKMKIALGSRLDIAFWTIGGFAAGLLA